jgi:hypothetical protein
MCSVPCSIENPHKKYSKHVIEQHGSTEGAFLNRDSSELTLAMANAGITYGHLYENEVNAFDPQKNMDWDKLQLDTTKLSKLKDMLRRHTVLFELVAKISSGKHTITNI